MLERTERAHSAEFAPGELPPRYGTANNGTFSSQVDIVSANVSLM